MKSKTPILLYHDLESPDCPNEKTNVATKGTVVSLDEFEGQMEYFFNKGYQTISLDEYFSLRTADNTTPRKRLVITFDDGHYSNYQLAYPVLIKYGYTASFFIIAERIDQKFHLSTSQIQEMRNNAMEIGSHGVTHNYLPLMNYTKISAELRESKQTLESIISYPVNYFAFPGGHYNKDVLDALVESRYTGACSCLQGLNTFDSNPYLLKRIEIRRQFSSHELDHLFNPVFINFYQFIDWWKRALRRTVGLEKYAELRSRLYKFYILRR